MTTARDGVICPLMGLSKVTASQVACVADGAAGCTHLVEWLYAGFEQQAHGLVHLEAPLEAGLGLDDTAIGTRSSK